MANDQKRNGMVYNYLGKSGIQVSSICLGTNSFGQTQTDSPTRFTEDGAHQFINRYVELGGNFLDTAHCYNNGQSEEFIGKWLERQNRDKYIISTKVGPEISAVPLEGDKQRGASRRYMTKSLDTCLKRLRTDYVDLYQIHCWDNATPIEETIRTLDDFVRCGKVRYIGASNLCGWQLQKMLDLIENLGLNSFVSLQQQYNLIVRSSELGEFPVCQTNGVAVLPWSPLKGGLLTGKHQRETGPTEGRIKWVADNEKNRAHMGGPAWSSLDDQTFDIIDTVKKIAERKGRSPSQVALKWLLQKSVVSSVIIGVTSIAQLEDNMVAGERWWLSSEEMKELNDVSERPAPYPYNLLQICLRENNPFLPSSEVESVFP